MKDEFLLEMLHSGAGSIDGNNSFTISDPNKVVGNKDFNVEIAVILTCLFLNTDRNPHSILYG